MNSKPSSEIAQLKETIMILKQNLENQESWINNMLPQFMALCVRNEGLNEFIIESLRAGSQSRGFTIVIQNCPREFLASLRIDLSKYVAYDSPIFDIIANSGYDISQLHDLEQAILTAFKFNYCLPHMPNWRIMIRRINYLTQQLSTPIINWDSAVRIFDGECSHSRKYIQQHPDYAAWKIEAAQLRSHMIETQAIQVD